MCKSALSVLIPIPSFLEPYVYFTPDHPEFGIDDQGRRCLAVDECMVPALQALWDREIPTISACCLHGAGEGVITLPRVVEPGETLPKPNWLQRDEALSQRDALAVEVAMLRAALDVEDQELKQAEADSWKRWSSPETWGNTVSGAHAWGWQAGYEFAKALLAAPAAAGGEHGSAVLAAADAMAEASGRIVEPFGGYDEDEWQAFVSAWATYRCLRGASAASGQGAGEQGGEEITG